MDGGGWWLWAASCDSWWSEKPEGLVAALGSDFWRNLICVGGRVAQLDARETIGSGEKAVIFPLIPKATIPVVSSPTLGWEDHRSVGSVTGQMGPHVIPKDHGRS